MQQEHPVYHFTSSAFLPWIVASGELRPGRNQIADRGFPADFLWATTNPRGDRTSTAMIDPGYRSSERALIRLTLHDEDFERWPDIVERFPEWTDMHVQRLEAAARRRGEIDFSCWRARATALPLSRIIAAEAKTFTTNNWKVVEFRDACLQSIKDPALRGFILNGFVYTSVQVSEPGKPTSLRTGGKLSADEWHRGVVHVRDLHTNAAKRLSGHVQKTQR